MKNIRSLIDMPVVCCGKKTGRVAQVCLSEDLQRMDGLWIDAGLSGTRFVPAEHICRLGDAAVLTDVPGRRMRCGQQPLFLRAVSEDGLRLGAVSGAEIDELSFRVEALELSHGYLDDLLAGRTRVRSFTVSPQGGSVIIDLSGEDPGT